MSQNIKITFWKIKAEILSLFISSYIYIYIYIYISFGQLQYCRYPTSQLDIHPTNHPIKVVSVYSANLTSFRWKYSRSTIKLPCREEITYQFSKQMRFSCVNCTLTFYCNVLFPSRNKAFISKLFVSRYGFICTSLCSERVLFSDYININITTFEALKQEVLTTGLQPEVSSTAGEDSTQASRLQTSPLLLGFLST